MDASTHHAAASDQTNQITTSSDRMSR